MQISVMQLEVAEDLLVELTRYQTCSITRVFGRWPSFSIIPALLSCVIDTDRGGWDTMPLEPGCFYLFIRQIFCLFLGGIFELSYQECLQHAMLTTQFQLM